MYISPFSHVAFALRPCFSKRVEETIADSPGVGKKVRCCRCLYSFLADSDAFLPLPLREPLLKKSPGRMAQLGVWPAGVRAAAA